MNHKKVLIFTVLLSKVKKMRSFSKNLLSRVTSQPQLLEVLTVLFCTTLVTDSLHTGHETSVLNCQTLKTLFLQFLVMKKVFFKKIEWYAFFLLYLWAKYKPIWSYITAQTVTLGANLLVKAQTIPQNAKCMFFKPKVAFTKDIYIFNMAKVFEQWLFLHYWNMWKYLKGTKMCPKNLNIINKPQNHKV